MISNKDKIIIEDLAKKQLELAKSEKMENLKKLWLKSNTLKAERPMVTVELWTFADEVLPGLMKCEGEQAREIEAMLLSNIVNTTLFGDDTVVRDYIPVCITKSFTPFNIPVEREFSQSGGVGHHFKEAITDLDKDFHKLGKSVFDIDFDDSKKKLDYYNEILGHILPAKLSNPSFGVGLTQDVLHIMSMENFMYSMFDYPEKVKEMMSNLSDDYIEFIDLLEKNGCFIPTVGDESVYQGTYAFTDELDTSENLFKNTWLYLDSQESVGISPDMYSEFIFPYYKKIMDKAGIISYGCCEPVDPIWDTSLSKVENLRKVSISPWCNEEVMAERLKGTKVVYHRKPSPNFIGVGKVLDEDAVRKSIGNTVSLNKGRSLEITQRDVYTINNDIEKVRRYVEIIREESEKNW